MGANRPLKVLLVDDQPAVVEALGVLLDLHGIRTIAASTPEAALRALSREAVGVVIQDMNFGAAEVSGKEGVALFRRLRAAAPELPILLMTAWASLETAVQLVKEGACDYLAKPWDDRKLVTSVKNLLRMRELQVENARLVHEKREAREVLAERFNLCGLVYESAAMHRLVSLAVNVAASDAPVLITGPSGSGKEKIAEIVQANSRRAGGPFLRLNVAAIPHDLIESELFGAEPGAFTGSTKLRTGRFEAAGGGTIFLDEIDGLPLAGQVKLLRVVQTGEFQRLGSSTTRRADVRILSATNSDLTRAIAGGTFREDLFFRLNVVELAVPALRVRSEDVVPLARHFLPQAPLADGAPSPELGTEAVDAMLAHDWSGNVRELQNRIQRASLLCRGSVLTPEHLGLGPVEPPGRAASSAGSVEEVEERARIERALLAAKGVVAHAAEGLGVSRQALYRRMVRLGIVLERRPRP